MLSALGGCQGGKATPLCSGPPRLPPSPHTFRCTSQGAECAPNPHLTPLLPPTSGPLSQHPPSETGHSAPKCTPPVPCYRPGTRVSAPSGAPICPAVRGKADSEICPTRTVPTVPLLQTSPPAPCTWGASVGQAPPPVQRTQPGLLRQGYGGQGAAVPHGRWHIPCCKRSRRTALTP